MAWAVIDDNASFNSLLAQKIVRPAVFVYLDWPSGEVFASTFHKSVTTSRGVTSPATTETWTGVGNLAMVEAPQYQRNGAQITYKVGITSLPQENVSDATEAAAIGRRAKLYIGLFDENWENPVLSLKFIGHIITAGNFRDKRDPETGNWFTDASIEISNGRSPRRHLQNHHSVETTEAGDTAWRLLPTVGRALEWPA